MLKSATNPTPTPLANDPAARTETGEIIDRSATPPTNEPAPEPKPGSAAPESYTDFSAPDTGGAIVTLTKAVPGPNGRLVVGNAQLSATPQGSYIVLKGKINYQSALAPDTLYIQLPSSASFGGGV